MIYHGLAFPCDPPSGHALHSVTPERDRPGVAYSLVSHTSL